MKNAKFFVAPLFMLSALAMADGSPYRIDNPLLGTLVVKGLLKKPF